MIYPMLERILTPFLQAAYMTGMVHGLLLAAIAVTIIVILVRSDPVNRNRLIALGLVGGLVCCCLPWKREHQQQPQPAKQPVRPLRPGPAPCPGPYCPDPPPRPEPRPPRRPWVEGDAPVGAIVEGGKVSPDGTTEITCDLPESEKKKNVGGRDGAGLCVFTSIEYSARWQNESALVNFQQQMRAERGGGWPEKVDKMVAKYAPGVKYVQHTGGDLEVLRSAIRSGRMPAVTYDGRDVHYRGTIAHMVSLAHLDDRWAVITDNNFPGDRQFVWMTPDEFRQRWGRGDGWAVVLLSPPPPPPPRN